MFRVGLFVFTLICPEGMTKIQSYHFITGGGKALDWWFACFLAERFVICFFNGRSVGTEEVLRAKQT